MPNMAAIAVTNAAAVAKSFDVLTPSAGTNAAKWQMTSESTLAFARPVLEMSTRPNAAKNAIKAFIVLQVPYVIVDPTSGLNKVVAVVPIRVEATLPSNVPDVTKNDTISFFQGVVASALIRDSLRAAYAPS